MDPTFSPALRLLEKIENPTSNVDVDNLVASLGESHDLVDAARQALRARNFSRVLELTSEVLRTDLMNVDAQQIAEEAQSKIEAEPFIDQFVKSARNKIANGN